MDAAVVAGSIGIEEKSALLGVLEALVSSTFVK